MHNADPESLHKTICKAWSLRNKYINHSITNAYRLVNSYGDVLPEVTIDVYNKNLLVQYFKSYEKHSKDRLFSDLNDILTPESITEKTRLKGEDIKTHLVSGKEIPGDFIVLENGIKFNISFLEGGGTGLFLDQRNNRKKMQAIAKGKEVLNLEHHQDIHHNLHDLNSSNHVMKLMEYQVDLNNPVFMRIQSGSIVARINN